MYLNLYTFRRIRVDLFALADNRFRYPRIRHLKRREPQTPYIGYVFQHFNAFPVNNFRLKKK